MNLNYLKKITLLSLFITTPLFPIKKTNARIIFGTLCSLSMYGTYKGWLATNKKIHPLILVGCNSIAGYFAYNYLDSLTPQGRLNRATLIIEQLYQHTLIRHNFSTDEQFFNAINDVFLTEDLPLISAYNHLLSLLPMIHDVFGLINKASAEIGRDGSLQEQCNSTMEDAQDVFNRIAKSIKKVRQHRDYIAQLQIYKEFLMQEKNVAAYETMALAQKRIARASESSSFAQWIKWIFGKK